MQKEAIDALYTLLDQGQFELVDQEMLTAEKDDTDCRLIYLMNDTVESFIIFKNARYTGSYRAAYEEDIEYTLNTHEKFLKVSQGDSHFIIFFDDLELEMKLYNYSGIGHFWVDKYEDIRVNEFLIAVIRDKYEYLGEKSCNPLEKKLSQLKYFPPLNCTCFNSCSLIYYMPLENPWVASPEAIEAFREICQDVKDWKMLKLLEKYQQKPCKRTAQRMAKCLSQARHMAISDRIYELIDQAASQYPERKFNETLTEIAAQKQTWAKEQISRLSSRYPDSQFRIYREEPFVFDCDDIKYNIYVMRIKDGIFTRKITLLKN